MMMDRHTAELSLTLIGNNTLTLLQDFNVCRFLFLRVKTKIQLDTAKPI